MNQALLLKIKKAINKKKEIFFAYLFGSQVEGKVGKLSDIDIAVYLDPKISEEKRFDLKLKILEELAKNLKTENIDLVILNDAPPLLAHRILKEGVLIFSKDEKERISYEVRAVLEYLDFKPLLEKYVRETFK